MSQKVPFARSLGQVSRQKALDHIHNTGKNLPATVKSVKGAIMTVDFQTEGGYTLPSVTIPLFGPEYTRYPIQKGDKGVVVSTDAAIGNMSGLGPSKNPGLSRPGNLSPLVFLPIGNANWSKVDPDKMTNYGKGGALLRDKDGKAVIDTDATAGFRLGWGKPNTYDEANIDPSKYDHNIAGTNNGLASTSKAKITANAQDNIEETTQKSYKVNATTSADITAPQTNVNGNATISGTMQAALAALGGIGGIGGGAVPGNLSMGGNVAAQGNVSAQGNVTAQGSVDAHMIFTDAFTIGAGPNQLPAASALYKGARCYVTDANAPTWLQPLTGGGTTVCPAFCNGAQWVAG